MLKLKQIAVAQWGTTYSILGLSEEGKLYRLQKDGWIALTMHVRKENPPARVGLDEKPEDF